MADFNFSFPLQVRISDVNYGNHVSYAYYLLYFQDARIAYLNNLGFSELDIGGKGIIVTEVNCKYKRELKLGDNLDVHCKVSSLSSKGFEMDYEIKRAGKSCATSHMNFLCFDYNEKKVSALPEVFSKKVSEFEGI